MRLPSRRHRGHRLAMVGAVVLGVLALAPAPAGAAERVDRQAWMHTGSLPPTLPYQQQRLYVAATVGQEQARTFVHVDATGLELRQLRTAVLRLAEDPGDSALGESAPLAACALVAPVETDGEHEGSPPDADCTLRTDVTRDDQGQWSVELAVFAERWAEGANNGMAIFPTSGSNATFRVSFDPTQSAVTDIGEAPGSPVVSEVAPPFDADTPTPASPTPTFSAPPSPGLPVTPPAVAPRDPPPPAPRAAVRAATDRAPVHNGVTAAAFATLAVLAAAMILAARHFGARIPRPPTYLDRAQTASTAGFAVVAAVALLPLTFDEVNAYKAGLVLIFLIGALGLHVLVNWTGQLSLAHAGMVGLPALVVITLSGEHGISPLYLVPIGMLVGALLGGVVSLPTIRAKGLQVTLVTFAAGIAIERYFFTQRWLVGETGDRVSATPKLGPWTLRTSQDLYPVVLVVAVLVIAAMWLIMHSRLARAWFWIQEHEPAAATYGVPVARYKMLAYVTAGTLAGLSGALTAAWVQQLSSTAFPASTLSFTYLLVVVLAGRGFAGGVVGAVVLIEGGRLFLDDAFGGDVEVVIEYLGPVGLILNLVLYKGGFNLAGRQFMNMLRKNHHVSTTEVVDSATSRAGQIPLMLLGSVVLIAAGILAIALAWYQAGNTDELWIQNQELLSGGIGGLALVIVGVALLICDRLAANRSALAREVAAILSAQRADVHEALVAGGLPELATSEHGR